MTVRAAVEAALDLRRQGRVAEWIDLMAEDIVFEFPFAPPGYPARLSGREAVFAHIKDLPSAIQISDYTEVRMHQTLDPDTLIVEFGILARIVTTDRPYNQRYVCVIQMKAGKIARYRDYWNPLVALAAFEGRDATESAPYKSPGA